MDRRSALVLSRGFEHRLLKIWRRYQFQSEAVLVAVSGGVDSVALLVALEQWSRLLKLKLKIAHVHHGNLRGKQGQFRDSAQASVGNLASHFGLDFVTNQREKNLGARASESELRDFRWSLLNRWRLAWQEELGQPVVVATAHTQDDLLETRLLRLIRGTGIEGLMGMSFRDPRCVRPLLFSSKREVVAYAKAKGISWIEDPSNQNLEPTRNWLRREWLPQLEKKCPGGERNLAQSFERILKAIETGPEVGLGVPRKHLDRAGLRTKDNVQQRQAVASYFRAIGLKNYSEAHVEELLKRLKSNRREFSFEMLGRMFMVTLKTIVASPI